MTTSTRPRQSPLARDRQTSSLVRLEDASNQSQALRGATHAFNSPVSKLQPMTNTYSGTNGALAASRMAGMGRSGAATEVKDGTFPSHLLRPVGRSSRHPSAGQSLTTALSGNPETLDLPTRSMSTRLQSPSHIAATLAAARPTSDSMAEGSRSSSTRRPSPLRFKSFEPPLAVDPPDGTSIATTNKLIELFESKNALPPSCQEREDVHMMKAAPLIVSPTPLRPPLVAQYPSERATFDREIDTQVYGKHSMDDFNSSVQQPKTARVVTLRSERQSDTSKGQPQLKMRPQKSAPELPPPRGSARLTANHTISDAKTTTISHGVNDNPSIFSTSSYTSAPNSVPVHLQSLGYLSGQSSDVSRSKSSPSGHLIPQQNPNVMRPRLPTRSSQQDGMLRTLGSKQDTRMASSRLVPQLTADSLANAIVASSLASSRAGSPTKTAPTIPMHHSKPYSLFRQGRAHGQLSSRTPSPPKSMRQSMRDPRKSDDEDEYHKGSHHIIKKHPNKHHEGDRKRWRDQITERERKRYEGVWAANRGLLIPLHESQDLVCNLVVRDIWRRSNLSDHLLGEIWDLVDKEGAGRLSRDEFAVGMWLIDQCLKGRKLPVKVSESVWSSVRRLHGIIVPKSRR
ncbi:Increased rDNA silencing protein [Lignoscripta atroalba]|nr:Increased rDNA silencing protein [Lignoscripta atroalba]